MEERPYRVPVQGIQREAFINGDARGTFEPPLAKLLDLLRSHSRLDFLLASFIADIERTKRFEQPTGRRAVYVAARVRVGDDKVRSVRSPELIERRAGGGAPPLHVLDEALYRRIHVDDLATVGIDIAEWIVPPIGVAIPPLRVEQVLGVLLTRIDRDEPPHIRPHVAGAKVVEPGLGVPLLAGEPARLA